jgi:hypothetical protein
LLDEGLLPEEALLLEEDEWLLPDDEDDGMACLPSERSE